MDDKDKKALADLLILYGTDGICETLADIIHENAAADGLAENEWVAEVCEKLRSIP